MREAGRQFEKPVGARTGDLDEILFRFAERAHDEPVLRQRLIGAVRLVMRAAIIEKRLGGDRLYQEMRALSLRWARWRAPRLARMLSIDVHDARDLGRIQDWEDELLGVTGHWVEAGPGCAEKHETACPFADLAQRDTRICSELVHGLESETFRTLNPRYRLVPLGRLLSKGQDRCEFRHHIDASEQDRPSDRHGEEMNREPGA